jgi:hypothetical protein
MANVIRQLASERDSATHDRVLETADEGVSRLGDAWEISLSGRASGFPGDPPRNYDGQFPGQSDSEADFLGC